MRKQSTESESNVSLLDVLVFVKKANKTQLRAILLGVNQNYNAKAVQHSIMTVNMRKFEKYLQGNANNKSNAEIVVNS